MLSDTKDSKKDRSVPKKVRAEVADAPKENLFDESIAEPVADAERFGARAKANEPGDGDMLSPELLKQLKLQEPKDAMSATAYLFGNVANWLAWVSDSTKDRIKAQLGKMRTQWRDIDIVNAAISAQQVNAIDPLSYMRGVLRAVPKKGSPLGKKYHADVMDEIKDW